MTGIEVDPSTIIFVVDIMVPSVDLSVAAETAAISIGATTPNLGVQVSTPTTDIASAGPPPVILVPTPGVPGPRGFPGTGVAIYGETLAGLINGVNTVFTTNTAFQSGSTGLYLNGLREFLGDAYTETTSTTIELSDPPLPGDTLRIDYVVA